MKGLIVDLLEWMCTALDSIPDVNHDETGWHYWRYGDWGCRLKLAQKSALLDERWNTGRWS